MAGGGQPNNKNAEKWTTKEIIEFIDRVYSYVNENKECSSLVEAITECGEYEQILRYFETKESPVDFAPIKKAKDIIKQRLIKNGLNGTNNPTMSIFILKNNHDMKDKSEVEQKTNLSINNYSDLPLDELEKKLNERKAKLD